MLYGNYSSISVGNSTSGVMQSMINFISSSSLRSQVIVYTAGPPLIAQNDLPANVNSWF